MVTYLLNVDPYGEGNYNPVYRISLDGKNYTLNFRWDRRASCFHMRLGVNGEDYLFKTKVTTNSDLLEPYKTIAGCPQGQLLVLDTTLTNGRISYEEFGFNRRFGLVYTEPS